MNFSVIDDMLKVNPYPNFNVSSLIFFIFWFSSSLFIHDSDKANENGPNKA